MNIEYCSTYSLHSGGYMEVSFLSRTGGPGNLLGSGTNGDPLKIFYPQKGSSLGPLLAGHKGSKKRIYLI